MYLKTGYVEYMDLLFSSQPKIKREGNTIFTHYNLIADSQTQEQVHVCVFIFNLRIGGTFLSFMNHFSMTIF